jgi:hypothetical protein
LRISRIVTIQHPVGALLSDLIGAALVFFHCGITLSWESSVVGANLLRILARSQQ